MPSSDLPHELRLLLRRIVPLPGLLSIATAAALSERPLVTLGVGAAISGLHIALNAWVDEQHRAGRDTETAQNVLRNAFNLVLVSLATWSSGATGAGWLVALPLLPVCFLHSKPGLIALRIALVVGMTAAGTLLAGERDPRDLATACTALIAVTLTGGPMVAALRKQLLSSHRAAEERARANAELQEALLAAQAAAEAKASFLANIGHELRTPIHGLLGASGLLQRTELSPEQLRLTEMLHSSGQGLLEVVDAVLDLSKIETEAMELERVTFDLAEPLRDAAREIEGPAREKGLELRCALPEQAVWVEGDPTRLRQAALALLSNALKFTSEGEILLAASWEPGRLSVAVQDTGPGISEERLATIFQPFGQESGSRRFGGAGLGLFLARRLVEQMGGEITAESALGGGSIFRFALPLQPVTAQDREGAPEPLGLRVLLAEDHLVNQFIAQKLLEELGCSVRVVGDGAEAVRAAATGRFDLVLMDCHMPVMDGLEATARIRKLVSASLPIVAVTASTHEEDRSRCLAAGMDGFLAKPFHLEALAAAIHAAMASKQQAVAK